MKVRIYIYRNRLISDYSQYLSWHYSIFWNKWIFCWIIL